MKIVAITGGSAGIGQAAAVEAARHGFGVVLTYRSRESEAAATVAEIEVAGGSAAALPLDVSDLTTIPAFVESLTKVLREKWNADSLDALVNNAGIGGGAPFDQVTEEAFDRFHRILVKGPYFLTQRLLRLLADGGAIVNTGSTSALLNGTEAGYSAYASQKGAMHALTRCWAKDLAPRGIRVNAVAPGSTRTRIAGDAFASLPPAALEQLAATVALGRVGEPSDIGRVIAFLIGPDSAWITGQILEASGGQGL